MWLVILDYVGIYFSTCGFRVADDDDGDDDDMGMGMRIWI